MFAEGEFPLPNGCFLHKARTRLGEAGQGDVRQGEGFTKTCGLGYSKSPSPQVGLKALKDKRPARKLQGLPPGVEAHKAREWESRKLFQVMTL